MSDYIAFDIETNGLNTRKIDIIGIGWHDGTRGDYVTGKENMKVFCELIKSQGKKLLCWNGFFDIETTLNFLGVDLWKNLHCDVQLLVHTCDENRRDYYRLKSVSKEAFGESAISEQDDLNASIKAKGGTPGQVWLGDTELVAKYCIKDCELTYKLWEKYSKILSKNRQVEFFYKDEIMPQYKTLTKQLQRYGVPINKVEAENARKDIEKDIHSIELEILDDIKPHLGAFYEKYNNSSRIQVKRGGNFLQVALGFSNQDLPRTKTGKISASNPVLEKYKGDPFVDFALGATLSEEHVSLIQKEIMKDEQEPFNINSKDHLRCVFIDQLGEKALSYTPKTKEPQLNDLFLDAMAEKYNFAKKIQTYNKLNKLNSNFIEKFVNKLEYAEDTETWRFYPSWKQWGTTTGRYAGDLMQLPKKLGDDEKIDATVIKYRNKIRDLIAGDFVGADYSSLEPHIAAHNSGEPLLQDCFNKGHDFYCTMAKVAFGQDDIDPDPKSPNYTKKVDPERRNSYKAPSLAKFYGQTPWGDHKSTGVTIKEAEKRHAAFFRNLPNCAKRMKKIEMDLQKYGQIYLESGRIRRLKRSFWSFKKWGDGILQPWSANHLISQNPECENEIRSAQRLYRADLRTALNFPNQSLANSIIARSAVAFINECERTNIPCRIIMQVHDELLVEILDPTYTEKIKNLLQHHMENTYKLTVPLKAVPELAKKYGDLK